jgi:hypothetical protein
MRQIRFPVLVLVCATTPALAGSHTAESSGSRAASASAMGRLHAARDAAERGDCVTARALEPDDVHVQTLCRRAHNSHTFEVAAGLGALGVVSLSELAPPDAMLPTFSLGIGKANPDDTPLTLRVSGTLFSDRGALAFGGVIGPHVQPWLGNHVFLGLGGGLAVYGRCDIECDGGFGAGLNARLGIALRPRGQSGANIAAETAVTLMPTAVYLTSLNVGYQFF